MDLFVAICLDHHIDEVVRVFSTPELAIADGWLYFATYGQNSVRVEKTTLDPED